MYAFFGGRYPISWVLRKPGGAGTQQMVFGGLKNVLGPALPFFWGGGAQLPHFLAVKKKWRAGRYPITFANKTLGATVEKKFNAKTMLL